MSSRYERKILEVLKKHKDGLTTVNVAKEADISKTTAIKYLAALRAEGKVDYVEVGPSKLWRIKRREKPTAKKHKARSKSEKLEALMEEFKEATGVEGSAIVDSDGFTISADLPDGMDPERFGSLISLLLRTGMKSVDAAKLKSLEGIIIEGGEGRIVIRSEGKVLVAAFCKPDTPLGTVRLEMKDLAEKINKVLT
ncbi:MAG: helix-turn-helix, type 11 domain-containing protein [Candidatus Bathyarchaeota archaeon B26-2]|nr:MAG: helix-turn-helix, type 11 domain-containing protein [Candidatus Bathyarchaeota archaeon B26-2]